MINFLEYWQKISIKQLIYLNVIVILSCLFIFIVFIIQGSTQSHNKLSSNVKNLKSTPIPTPVPTPVPTPTPLPTRIEIPSIGIDTEVVEISYVQETNEIEVPHNANQVGWYEHSPTPGSHGGTIFTAHYDTPTGAPAIFYNLNKITPKSKFYITNNIGQRLEYTVKQIKNLPLNGYSEEDKNDLFGDKDYSQISLITCAGVWDPVKQIYSNRLAVIGKLTNTEIVKSTNDIARLDSNVDQYSIENINWVEQPKDSSLIGTYIKLKDEGSKIGVYIATNNQDIIASDILINFDPSLVRLNTQNILINSLFETYYIDNINKNNIFISLFTDPKRSSKNAINTHNKELKIAELNYQLVTNDIKSIPVNIINNSNHNSGLLKYQPNQEIHQSQNILNTTKGIYLNK